MENSPTGDAAQVNTASEEPTVTPAENTSAEQSQEAISNQETASEAKSAEQQTQEPNGESQETQTQQNGSEAKTDDALAKFAKSQGFDPENLTDGERRALKIAHDNQKFARSQKVAESKSSVAGDITNDDIQAFQAEFREYRAQREAESFFAQDGRDDSLAPVMSEIIEEKKAAHGAEYARVLAADLPLLYDLAVVRSGKSTLKSDEDAIRKQERESINKQISGGATPSHATHNTMAGNGEINEEWFTSTYDPSNPEHVKIANAYFSN